jgi:Tol biopolymer transport system component
VTAVLAAVVAIASVGVLVTPAGVGAHIREDVPDDHPFVLEITWMIEHDVMDGYDDDTFRPAAPVSRQAFASFLHRHAGSPPVPSGAPTFSDVPGSHPFRKAIRWMAAEGITTGHPDGTFRPLEPVSREAAAAFLHRYAGEPAPDPGAPSFLDVPNGHVFATAISWLADVGITEGYPGNRFRPSEAVSRQAAAAFLYRYDDRDAIKGTLTRASVGASGAQAAAESRTSSLSDDGRYVAFESDASLHPTDTNTSTDVYVRDRTTNQTRLVSVAANGGAADSDSSNPMISGNGRFVVFESVATNLLADDVDAQREIYLHDLTTDNTSIVSTNVAGEQADGPSSLPSISADGQRVSFASSATDLVPGDEQSVRHVFVRDIGSATMLVPTPDEPLTGEGGINVTLSADGETLVYCAETDPPGLSTIRSGLYRVDLGSASMTEIADAPFCADDELPPAISADGRYVVAWSTEPLVAADTNGKGDLYRFDAFGAPVLVTVTSDETQPSAGFGGPGAVSADGRYVAFESSQSYELHDDDSTADIYLRDVVEGTTSRVSVWRVPQIDDGSRRPVISGNGRVVGFESDSPSLVPGDTNGEQDVFVFAAKP